MQHGISLHSFGSALRNARIESELTQAALAERVGIHKSMVCKIERGVGNPTWAQVQRLVIGLQVPLEDLVVSARMFERVK